MSDLNEVIRKIREQSTSNSQYKPNGQLVDQRRKEIQSRLPTLDICSVNASAIFLQYTDINRFTDQELLIIVNSGLEDLEYSGEVTQIEKVLDSNNPSFDIDGIILNNDIRHTTLRKALRRALASHKSLTGSFQSTFLSNI